MTRKFVDCREFPNDVNCTLRISGEEDEVVNAAANHSIAVHAAEDNAELRDMIRKVLKDEPEELKTRVA